ncbi:2'-5' RNA ligase family protein [Brevibacterium daeguense]|uniref:2'-5' RNA ligase family protein n=1 Tax=Brevibacterium daeguense TaxID=909936 RepID=UPI001F407BEA
MLDSSPADSFGPRWGASPDAPAVPTPDENGMVSIGITLDVPEPFATTLREARLRFGDERGESVPTHITLVPPMEIPVESTPGVRGHVRAVANETSPFVIQLRGTGTFLPTSPVVFIAVSRGISECQTLSERLRHGVLNQALAYPYHPHVTIAQELPEEALEQAYQEAAQFTARFMVHGFGVYFHDEGGRWQLFDRVPFGP